MKPIKQFLIIACLMFSSASGALALDDKPNIVVVFTDDQGYGDLLSGKGSSPHEAFFYYQRNTLQAVRSGQWKLHLGKSKRKRTGKRDKVASSTQLFDLSKDIGEKKNVLKDHPEVVARLRGYVDVFEKELSENSRPAGFVKNPKPLSKQKPPELQTHQK